jgi:2'-5' RNA ligase superfamily
MAKALELLLDSTATSAVTDIWAHLDASGIPSMARASHRLHRPHVSLINVETLTVADELIARLTPLMNTELAMTSLAIFPGSQSVLFLGVCATKTLLDNHAAVHEVIPDKRTGPWEIYQPGSWVPHCALALRLDADAVSKAFSLLHPFRPLTARVVEISVVDSETGEHEHLLG